jgi:probable HAF family extracellular repeat protein/VCBS repeat-containing protein
VNDSGQIVGYYDSNIGRQGFLLSGGSFTTINYASITYAYDINDNGQIVGHSGGSEHGFLYDGGTFTTLDDPLGTGGTLAYGINNNGQIVGIYRDSTGNHGFLATPDSPPVAKDDIAGATKNGAGVTKVTADATHGVLANDTDPDNDTLHISAVNGDTANVGHALLGAYGTLTLNSNGSYSYTATKGGGASGLPQDTFTYTVDDGHGGTSTATLTVSVVGNGQTYVKGTDGNDALSAGAKATVLDGGNGNDTLVGGNGSDALVGGNGADVLTGNRGNDTLIGGKDSDTFVFGPNFGKDVVTDFTPGDHIQIDHTLFANFAAVQAHAANDGHGNTVITYDANDTITLTGVTPSQLHGSDFFFV